VVIVGPSSRTRLNFGCSPRSRQPVEGRHLRPFPLLLVAGAATTDCSRSQGGPQLGSLRSGGGYENLEVFLSMDTISSLPPMQAKCG